MFEFDLEEDFCSIYVDETILRPFNFQSSVQKAVGREVTKLSSTVLWGRQRFEET